MTLLFGALVLHICEHAKHEFEETERSRARLMCVVYNGRFCKTKRKEREREREGKKKTFVHTLQ